MKSPINNLEILKGTPIEATYLQLLDALNRHSAEDFSNLFLDNGVFVLIDGTELKSKKNIRDNVEKLFVQHPDYSYFSKITTYQDITNDLKMVIAIINATNVSFTNSMYYLTKQTVMFSKQKNKWQVSIIINNLIEKENTSLKEKITELSLSAREAEILKFIVNGHTNEQISESLVISARTVDTHRSNILKKTGCRNISSLIAFAVSQDLINN